jgi:hypothetical protein
MAAAVRSDGKLAVMVPVMRTKAIIPTMRLFVRILLAIVSAAVIRIVIAIMAFFVAVALEMVYMGGLDKINAAGFIAVVVPVFVVVRIIAAVIIRIPVISIVIAVIPGFIQDFFSFTQRLLCLAAGFLQSLLCFRFSPFKLRFSFSELQSSKLQLLLSVSLPASTISRLIIGQLFGFHHNPGIRRRRKIGIMLDTVFIGPLINISVQGRSDKATHCNT